MDNFGKKGLSVDWAGFEKPFPTFFSFKRHTLISKTAPSTVPDDSYGILNLRYRYGLHVPDMGSTKS